MDKSNKIEKLLERQRKLDAQIRAEQKRQAERKKAEEGKRIAAVGELAREAGLLELPDEYLLAEFRAISTKARPN